MMRETEEARKGEADKTLEYQTFLIIVMNVLFFFFLKVREA